MHYEDRVQRKERIVKNVGQWEEGETVTIVLDMDKGVMEFFKEGKLLGKIAIENTRDYYPALAARCNVNSDFKLTADI